MKDKILTLIIGILIGAIIMACVFLVYTKNHPREEKNIENNQEEFQPNFEQMTPPDFNNQGQDGHQKDDFQFKGVPDGNSENGTFDRPTPPNGDFNLNNNFSEMGHHRNSK